MKYKSLRKLHRYFQQRADDEGYVSLDAYLFSLWAKVVLFFFFIIATAVIFSLIKLVNLFV